MVLYDLCCSLSPDPLALWSLQVGEGLEPSRSVYGPLFHLGE